MSWFYNDKQFTENDVGNYVGFIYLITDLENGKKYIGQKVFFNRVAKPPLKGKTKRRISKKQSDWMDYFGSNDVLKERVAERGSEKFKREILRLCTAKSEMNYWETYEIFHRHALIGDEYYNSWVSTRINKNQLKSMKV